MEPAYQYSAEPVRVVDGDTIDVILDFGFSLKQKMRLRLSGIDTPELNSKDEKERAKAQEAKNFVMDLLFSDDGDPGDPCPVELVVKTIKTKAGVERQTFGRYVAEVYVEEEEGWVSLNEMLVKEGLAVVSKG